jgi:hypothetical protein
MGYKLGYHILVLPNQVLLINSVLTNEVLYCMQIAAFTASEGISHLISTPITLSSGASKLRRDRGETGNGLKMNCRRLFFNGLQSKQLNG